MQRKMFQVQSNLVKHYAESENCVIIGDVRIMYERLGQCV